MNRLHATLHLQHHKHTGKVLPHHHTSFRSLFVIFVVAGLLMIGVNIAGRVAADSLITLYGTVPISVPSQPPVISLPAQDSVVQTSQILVMGSCPLVSPQVSIAIVVDGNRAGSGTCDGANAFSITVTLTPGAHSIYARPYTITGSRGTDSETIHVTYTPPAQSDTTQVPVNASPASKPAIASPVGDNATTTISIASDKPFLYLGTSRTIEWTGTFTGGSGSYKVVIEWGDTIRSTYKVTAGHQKFSHHYDTVASYDATVLVEDSSGQTAQYQFAVASYAIAQSTTGHSSAGGNTLGTTPFSRTTAFGLYAFFVTTLLALGIFWIEGRKRRKERQLLEQLHGGVS